MRIVSSYLALFMFLSIGTGDLRAEDLSVCTVFGNYNLSVTERITSVEPGSISPGPKVALHMHPDDICKTEECNVPMTSNLNAGLKGVAIGRHQSWVCVAVPGKKPLEVWLGWVPEQRWKQSNSNPELKNWVGVWQNDHAKIKIGLSETNELSAIGNAIWSRGITGDPHFGEFEIKGNPDGGVLETPTSDREFDCHVALRMVGDFIFVSDNGHCGGMNVHFNGMYRFRRGLA